MTLVPLRVYFKQGRAKAELAVAKGKKLYDKRHAIKIREAKRELDQALKASAADTDTKRGRPVSTGSGGAGLQLEVPITLVNPMGSVTAADNQLALAA